MNKLTLNYMKNAMNRIILISIIIAGISIFANSQSIDIGLYPAAAPNTVDVKIRPDFTINTDETITGILYTIRWDDLTTTSLTAGFIFPFFVAPQGPPVLHNGYYYQVFGSVPGNPYPSTINPGDEVTISSFSSSSGGSCVNYEIIVDDWTFSNNGNFYLELVGADVTGIIYEPWVNFGTVGGNVTGGSTINLGDPTGSLLLEDYQGTVTTWQKRHDQGTWSDISSTVGLTTYSETPASSGVWDYRCEVQFGSCAAEYSDFTQVIVLGTSPSAWNGSIDNDWFKAGNWDAGIPWALNAVIPDVAPNPYPLIVGSAVCNGLDIDADASVTIDPTSTLTAAGPFINDGNFEVQSSALGTGSFIDNGTISGSGTFNVERYLTEEKWHYISPVISDGLSAIFLDIYLMSFDEVAGEWTYIVPVNIPLNVMEGYAAWPSTDLTSTTTVSYEGTLNTGPKNIDLTRTNIASHGSIGYNFVGNPYPSSVNWNTDAGWTKTNIDNAIYLYNSDQKQYGAYIYGDPVGTNMVTNIIPPGQGFFVHVSDEFTTGNLAVNNDAREHNDKPFFKASNTVTEKQILKLQVTNAENNFKDECLVQFEEGGQSLFEADKDAYKMFGDIEAPQIYTKVNDSLLLSINTFGQLVEQVVIPMGFETGVSGTFTLDIADIINFDESTEIFLEDTFDDILVNLTSQSEYSFYAEPGDNPDRFILYFNPNFVSSDDQLRSSDLQIYSFRDNLIVRSLSNEMLIGKLMIHDIYGRKELTKSISDYESRTRIDKEGVYVVTFFNSTNNKLYKRKIIIQ